ncbi:MAG TPA: glycosyl transferase family 2 [Cytophagales bacterium]|jgi:putative flippase GtrA|nr:glycosyl transferase family 2 [Cytophagales bacterium]
MIELNETFFYKFLKFGVVGMSGMAVDFGITYFLKEKIKINKYFANTFGFFSAATSNFILNRLWTFQSADPQVTSQYFRFLVIAVVGVLFSNAIIYLLHERFKWNFYLAKLISIGVVLFWNFFANYFFTFVEK